MKKLLPHFNQFSCNIVQVDLPGSTGSPVRHSCSQECQRKGLSRSARRYASAPRDTRSLAQHTRPSTLSAKPARLPNSDATSSSARGLSMSPPDNTDSASAFLHVKQYTHDIVAQHLKPSGNLLIKTRFVQTHSTIRIDILTLFRLFAVGYYFSYL